MTSIQGGGHREVFVARRDGSARKARLLAGSAVALVLTASAVQAQCVTGGGFATPFGAIDPGVTSSGVSSSVQSLITVLSTTNTAFLTQTSGFIGAPSNPAAGQAGGGTWVRGIGGTLDTNTPGGYSYTGLGVGGGGACQTRTFQDFSGIQVGADISKLNINGGNFHLGVTAGYAESRVRSRSGPGGTFNGDFQIPFVGIYAAYTKDGLFIDGQVRWDFYQGILNDPQTSGIFNQRLDARSLSFTGNIGKQFSLDDNWFVEPSIGGVYSQAKVDSLSIPGTLVLTNNAGFAPPSTFKINDFDSILGRASLRVGKNVLVGDFGLQPFFTASVFHEFAGQVRTNINGSFDTLGPFLGLQPGALAALDTAAVLTSGRIGTYGQFAVGIAGQLLNTGWLGYVRGDYRIGERVEGMGISAGLRYQFNPETVIANGVISKDTAPILPILEGPVSWTGITIGGTVGATWSRTFENIAGVGTVEPHVAGINAGGAVGANYQFGNFVVGVEGDVGYVNAAGGKSCPGGAILAAFYTCESQIDFLAMATGKVGYAYERTLFYAKGGAAFADVTERIKDNTGGQPLIFGFSNQSDVVRTSAMGWTVGAGFEFMLTRSWSAKAEYMHYELDTRAINYAVLGQPATVTHRGDLVRIGVNYRFGMPEPAAAAPRAVLAKY